MIPILDIPDHRVLVGSSLAEQDLDLQFSSRTISGARPMTLPVPSTRR